MNKKLKGKRKCFCLKYSCLSSWNHRGLYFNDFAILGQCIDSLAVDSHPSQMENQVDLDMELYYLDASPPCRAVLLFIHALSLKPILKEIDLLKGEHLTPEYRKLNPQHTIPIIVEDGFVLSESRAILGYLAEQYAPNSTYYPNDPKARGVVNQRLLFDMGTLYQAWLDSYWSAFKSPEPMAIDPEKLQKLDEAFGYLETFMGDSHWMAGDEMTIADFSLVATVSTIEASGFDFSKYSKVYDWLERCKKQMVDYEEVNQKGANIIRDFLLPKIKN